MAARAMRANGVTMSHCAQQISEHFLDLLRKAEANATAATHDAAGATSEPGPGEADEGEAGEAAEKAAGEEHSQAEAVQESPLSVWSSAECIGRTFLHACGRKPWRPWSLTRMPCFLHLHRSS